MNQQPESPQLDHQVFGPFCLEVTERRLWRGQTEIALTPKTFDLLLTLVKSAGQLCTRQALIDTLWPDTIVEEHGLTWNISALRKALGDAGDGLRYIETVRGHGYRFTAEVHPGPTIDAVQHTPTVHVPPPPAAVNTAAVDTMQTAPAAARRRIAALASLAIVLALTALLVAVLPRRHGTPAPPLTQALPPHSIAVLPFANRDADDTSGYFALGIQDMILIKLAAIADLRVLSRTATRHYQSHPADPRQVAKELGVTALLEGSVRKIDDQVLINVKLIDGANGSHLWAESYTRSLDHVFDIEREVAAHVATALKATLLPAETARLAHVPTHDGNAYDAFLRAEFLADQFSREGAVDMAETARQAGALYREAIALDPDFALAWARLAHLEVHNYYVFRSSFSTTASTIVDEASETALALDADLPAAHIARGYVLYYAHANYDAAIAEFEHARAGSPTDGEIDAAIAKVLRRQGNFEQALVHFKRAATLEPRNPRWPMQLGDTLTNLRRSSEATRAYERALAVDPSDYASLIYKGMAYLSAGELELAIRAVDAIPPTHDFGGLTTAIRFEATLNGGDAPGALRVLTQAPAWIEAVYMSSNVPTDFLRALAYESMGADKRARDAYELARNQLQVALRAQPDNPNLLSLLGLTHAALGQADSALALARRSVELRPISLDATGGPMSQVALAIVEGRLGHTDKAISRLRAVMRIPAGRSLSKPVIELSPRFAWLRAIEGGIAGSVAP